jgi:type VII secretion integral membrane protein EccD
MTAAMSGTERFGVRRSDRTRLSEQVRVAVLFDGRQTDLTLPATSSVASVVDAMLRVLLEPGESIRSADDEGMISAGTVVLARINGEPLDRAQTLAQQQVTDGDLLILEVADATVGITPVIENASSAIARANAERFSAVTDQTAVRFAAIAAGLIAVLAGGLGVNAWLINLAEGRTWDVWPAVALAGFTAVLLVSAMLIWVRRREMVVVATALWLAAIVTGSAAAAAAAPSHPGAWHVAFAAATAAVIAAALWKLTPVTPTVLAWITLSASGVCGCAVVHALGVSMTYVATGAVVVAVFVLKSAETLAARMAAIPMPPFPTATGKLVFDDADDIAADALVAAETDGTPSVAELTRAAAAANGYLGAIVAATAPFFVWGAACVVTPGQGRWWLATVFVAVVAAVLVFRGRAFADPVPAVVVVATALTMMAAVSIKYAVVVHNPWLSIALAGGVALVGLAALMIAAIVPRRSFSPVFRKAVEWIEYLLTVLVVPFALWLLNIFALARNH